MTKKERILKYMGENPEVSDAAIAGRLRVSKAYVYKLRKVFKESGPLDLTPEMEANPPVEEQIELPLPPAPTEVGGILDERHTTYGTFAKVAETAFNLKDQLIQDSAESETYFTYSQIEAMSMICTKLARIVNGNPKHVDSWRDIAGYATLVADELEGFTR